VAVLRRDPGVQVPVVGRHAERGQPGLQSLRRRRAMVDDRAVEVENDQVYIHIADSVGYPAAVSDRRSADRAV